MPDQMQEVYVPNQKADEAARRKKDRMNRRDLGLLGMLSGDKVLSGVGESIYERNAPRSGSGLQSLGKGLLYDSVSGETITSKEYEEALSAERKAQRERDDRLQENRLAIANANYERQQSVVPEATARNAAQMEYMANAGNELANRLEQLPETKEKYADLPADIARRVGAGGVATLYEGFHKTSEERDLKAAIAGFVGVVRKERYGAALTDSERAEWAKEDPLASGIDSAESAQRLRNLAAASGRQAEGIRAGRAMPGGQQTQPQPTATPQGYGSEDEARQRLEELRKKYEGGEPNATNGS